MSRILQDLLGELCQMDNVVYCKDKGEHEVQLEAVLRRIQQAVVTLNKDKCEFRKLELLFLGHRTNQYEVQADRAKTSAIQNMCPPTNVSELRQFLGMANQQGSSQVNWSKLFNLFESYLARIGYGSGDLLMRKHSVRSKRSSASPYNNPNLQKYQQTHITWPRSSLIPGK